MKVGISRRLQSSRFLLYMALQLILVLVGALIATMGPVGVAVGTSMIATGVGGMVVFGWVVFDEAEADRRRVLDAFGFVTAFPHRSIQIKDEYQRRLRAASQSIDVMGFGLNALREDFLDQFSEWATRARVRILLVDPDAPRSNSRYVDIRDMEESNTSGRTRAEVLRFITDTQPLWSRSDSNFELRLATTLPSVNMFRIDDEAFWGPYLVSSSRFGRASRNLPTMIVKRPGYMFDRLVDHFDEIFTSEKLSRAPGSHK
ncbi:MAG: hypothetical protein JO197_18055 [Acidobacteria bacterium]|nr:hypothetical protein [Acidobacteriota bacterium]MBV9479009.1 hypothetical protein [Acidobacteriota bacterium]